MATVAEEVLDSTPEDRGDIIGPEDEQAGLAQEAKQAPEPEKPEPEPETTDEVAEESEESEEPEEPTESPTVPLNRLNAEISRRKQAQAHAQELEARIAMLEEMQDDAEQPQEEQFDFAGKLLEKNEAILQGDAARAAQLEGEIMDEQRKLMTNEAATISTRAAQMSQDEVDFNARARYLMDEYPEFDPDAPEYVEENLAFALDLRDSFVRAGDSKTTALQKAVDLAVPKLGLTPRSSRDKQSARKTAPSKEDASGVRRKSQAASAQPPKMDMGSGSNSQGEGSIPSDINELSEDEFDALPESTKARMRGDYLE